MRRVFMSTINKKDGYCLISTDGDQSFLVRLKPNKVFIISWNKEHAIFFLTKRAALKFIEDNDLISDFKPKKY